MKYDNKKEIHVIQTVVVGSSKAGEPSDSLVLTNYYYIYNFFNDSLLQWPLTLYWGARDWIMHHYMCIHTYVWFIFSFKWNYFNRINRVYFVLYIFGNSTFRLLSSSPWSRVDWGGIRLSVDIIIISNYRQRFLNCFA